MFLSFLFWKNFFICILNDKIRQILDHWETEDDGLTVNLWRAREAAADSHARPVERRKQVWRKQPGADNDVYTRCATQNPEIGNLTWVQQTEHFAYLLR